MTRHDDRKSRIRERMADTGEPYSVAARALAIEDEIEAADMIRYDPLFDGASTTSTIPAGSRRAMGMLTGPAEDCYELAVPDPTSEGGPDGRLAVIAGPVIYDGHPALVVQAIEVLEKHTRMPGLWFNSWSIVLYENGWRYATDGSDTDHWRIEITPTAGRPSAPVRVKVHDGGDYVLFDGPALLSPSWIARARHVPGGVLCFVGPCAGALVPDFSDDEEVDELLDTADLIAARIPVAVTEADSGEPPID